MIAIARTHTRSADVRFEVTTFEDFDARGGSRRLIVSAAAFHWVDPDVWWTKSHTLLEDDGWLAVLDSDTQYDEPLQSALHELWVRHSETGAAWATAPRVTMRDRFESSGYFTNVRHAAHVESQRQAPRQIQALMETTATWLAYTQATREAFRADLNHVLSQHREHVGATHTSSLWMGQRRPSQREATR